MQGVGDERGGGGGEGEVANEDGGEEFGGEGGGEVPFDAVGEMEGANLDVELRGGETEAETRRRGSARRRRR